MAVRTLVDPIDRDIELLISADLSPEEQSRFLADFAKKGLVEAQEKNRQSLGTLPPHETFVDGRRGAALESVRPDGTIVFEFELVGDVLIFIEEQLAIHSPFLTGRYTASHMLFADGVEVEPGTVPPFAREYVYVNSVPYARKIERGLSSQAPDGVYEAVAAMATSRFGNVARIRFTYREPLAGMVQAWATRRQTLLEKPNRRQFLKDIRQPAILVSLE